MVGAGTMGNGIAHVFAQAGWDTALVDVAPDALSRALKTIQANIERLIKKGAGSKEQGAETLGRIRTSTSGAHARPSCATSKPCSSTSGREAMFSIMATTSEVRPVKVA